MTLLYLMTLTALNFYESLKIGKKIIDFMKRDCINIDKRICDIVDFEITKSSMENIHGIIYKLSMKTNLGNIDIETWYQDLPNITAIHLFALNDENLAESPIRTHGNLFK